MRYFLLLSLSAICLAAPARAQNGNAAGMSPSTPQTAPGVPAPHELNTSDRVFMRAAAAGGLAEIDFGELAGGSGKSQLVKEFAHRMVSRSWKYEQETLGAQRREISSRCPPSWMRSMISCAKISGS